MGNQNSRTGSLPRGSTGSMSRGFQNNPYSSSGSSSIQPEVDQWGRTFAYLLPITKKELTKSNDERLGFGTGSMQGWRDTMEDAHAAILKLQVPPEIPVPPNKYYSFFGVYDGHGGDETAKYLSRNLHGRISRDPSFKRLDYRNAIKQGFYATDNEMRGDQVVGNSDSGATCIVGLVTPEDVLYIGNAGDCRAVISRGGEAVALSMDHKPTLPQETARIRRAGGVVEDERVEGDLAVSRALGDFEYKSHPQLPLNEQMVSPEPDVVEERLTENHEFLILACDGIWDCVTNKEAVDFVRTRAADGLPLDVICEQLMDRCLAREPNEIGIGCDNMTLCIVAFLMGRGWEGWKESIKRRLMNAPSAGVAKAPTPPMGSNVVTLNRPSARPAQPIQPPTVTVSDATPNAAVGGYVDTLARPKPKEVKEEAQPGIVPSDTTPVDASQIHTISYEAGEEMDDHYKNLTIKRKAHHPPGPAPPIPDATIEQITTEMTNTSISETPVTK